MFAVITFDREPLQWADLAEGSIRWVHTTGSFALLGLLLWLLLVLPRLRPADRARIPAWMSWAVGLCAAGSVALFAASWVLFLFTVALVSPAPGVAPPSPGLFNWLSFGAYTLANVLAIAGAGLPFVVNLAGVRSRRVFALAKLSFKEALRRRVLYAFASLLLVFLFASWFITVKAEEQVATYVGVVFWSMALLMLLTASLMTAFSIPADIRGQTIHTILTKPVERFEVVAGRFLGYLALMTLVLLFMTAVSLVYVFREVNPDAAEESLKARVPVYGELRFENTGDPNKGTNVGREWEYRQYITGPMPNKEPEMARWDFYAVPAALGNRPSVRCEFGLDVYRTTKGKEGKGVTCFFEFRSWRSDRAGAEQYRAELTGPYYRATPDALAALTKAGKVAPAVVARLEPLRDRPMMKEEEFAAEAGKLLPAEEWSNSQNALRAGLRVPRAEVENALAEKYGYYEVPAFQITDYHTLFMDVPAGVVRNALGDEAGRRQASSPGAPPVAPLSVRIRCNSPTQYVGMAKYDLYLRADEPGAYERGRFALNFFKAAFGLWLRLALMIGVAVALSTYFSGVISWLLTLVLFVCGLSREFIAQVAFGRNEGGGPLEAMSRLANRELTGPRPESSGTAGERLVVFGDEAFRWVVRQILDLIPDVDRYVLTPYVAAGFDVNFSQMAIGFIMLAGYLLPWAVLAFYLLRWREVASSS